MALVRVLGPLIAGLGERRAEAPSVSREEVGVDQAPFARRDLEPVSEESEGVVPEHPRAPGSAELGVDGISVVTGVLDLRKLPGST